MESNKFISVSYQLYDITEGKSDLIEQTSDERPFIFVSGMGVTLPAFEEQIVNLAALCPDCDIYAGNDDHVLPVLSVGGKGVISTIANVMPEAMHGLCEAFFKGDLALAREIQIQMIPLWKAAFCEVNPIPVKAMMGLMKLCSPDVRLPLVPLSESNLRLVTETLRAYELI